MDFPNPFDNPEYYEQCNYEFHAPPPSSFTPPPTSKSQLEIKLNRYSVDEIKEFTQTNPDSFIILSCRSKGLLRLNRNKKKGYEAQLVQSLKDILK